MSSPEEDADAIIDAVQHSNATLKDQTDRIIELLEILIKKRIVKHD